MQYINGKDALTRLNNKKKLYIMLLQKFDAQSMLDEFLEKIRLGDIKGAQMAAHTIKGTAANLSLIDLKSKAENIDIKLKNGDTDIASDISEIEFSVTQTINAVKLWIEENSADV